jgi:3-deoxy-D-manno-octulosonic-acid transferase
LRLLVAGSTLEGEEAALIAAWPQVLLAAPATAMILAPRHPERFAAVAAMLDHSGFAWRKRTAWGKTKLADGEIVLVDSIGELATIYALAAVAFVGGSLIAAGGHNTLESAQYRVPVVMGPHYENFRAIVGAMRDQDAIRIVTTGELAGALTSLLSDSAAAAGLGTRGSKIFAQQAGATDRTVAAIREILAGRS